MSEINEEEEKPNKEEPAKIYRLTDQINSFKAAKEKKPTKELKFLCDELIRYFKIKEKMISGSLDLEEERKKFLYKLSEKLEMLLTEAINMKSMDNRDAKVSKIYNWYKAKIDTFTDLKNMRERTEKEWYQEELPEVVVEEKDTEEDKRKHRGEQCGLEKVSKRINQFKTKHLLDEKNKNKVISFQDENLNFYSKDFKYNTMNTFMKTEEGFYNSNAFSGLKGSIYSGTGGGSLKSTFYGTNTFINKGKSKAEINTGTDWFRKTGLDFSKEIKQSYSYMRPLFDFEYLEAERNVLRQKQEELAEKRNTEEIVKAIQEFGFNRSFYKGNIGKRNDLKDVIARYKEILVKKKKEEEEKRIKEEEMRKIEELEKRREYEEQRRKRKEMMLLKNAGKTDENAKETNPGSNNNINDTNKNESGNLKDKVNAENKTNDHEDNKNVHDDKTNENIINEESEIPIHYTSKVDQEHIKYICPSAEKLKEVYNPREDVVQNISYPFKSSSNFYKLNNIKYHIKKLLDNDEKGSNNNGNGVSKGIPSDIYNTLNFNHKVSYLRNLNSKINGIKPFDAGKTSYMETFTQPLSLYDQRYKDMREIKKLRYCSNSNFRDNKAINLTNNEKEGQVTNRTNTVGDKRRLKYKDKNNYFKVFISQKNDYLELRKTISNMNEINLQKSKGYKNGSKEFKNTIHNLTFRPKTESNCRIMMFPKIERTLLMSGN